ncbi:hypothetical protein KFL_000450160 [Klebsormidium nitens]|uniref:WW domain-containing protein n=1 Tax=Klebsormidium nitens TaxID=105231 RepID=A0A1Y1HN49_KLENI|nr:hypothetical protein KFL_000450160 [Klebsormidium nitens]|eukprot:GAQ80060.1 hypothetical protein KFL_000450160 [Klebsormidium nitens]
MEARLKEKQALSEVIRIGLNRAQDLELLCQIQSAAFENPSLARQVAAECNLREEWRCTREAAVLQQMEGLSFATAEEDLGHLLADKARSLLQRSPSGASLRSSSASLRAPCTRDSSPYRTARQNRSPLQIRNGPQSPDVGRRRVSKKDARVLEEGSVNRSVSPLLRASRDPQVLALVQLHKTLLHGLKRHAACAGESAAHVALEEHVRAAQAHFAASLADVTQALADVSPGRPESKLGAAAFAFGDLGLPAALVARLVDLRRQQAARTVQRGVRKWSSDRRREAGEEELIQRQEAFRQNRAAQRIQDAFRTDWRKQRTRLAVVRSVRLRTSAGKIQRAFRCLLRRRRAACKHLDRVAAQRAALRQWKADRKIDILRQRAESAALKRGEEKRRWFAAVRIQSAVRRIWAKRDARRRRWAVGVLQKWARGWGVRRNMWWHRAVKQMRERRREAARVKARKQAIAQSWTAADRALTRLAALQADVRRTRDAIEREKAGFAAQWARWLEGLERSASAQPLPRGWLRQRTSSTGKEGYVNTRTAESQALHPALVGLLPEIEVQRAKGQEGFRARLAALEARLAPLEEAAEVERNDVLNIEMLRALVTCT